MIHGGMEVVRRPRQMERMFMTVMAPMAPRKTAARDLCTDMMLVMKKVLSPSSEAVISEEEAMKEFQKVLATAYGVILPVSGSKASVDRLNEMWQIRWR